MLIAEATPIPYVSRLLGHSSPSITMSIYAHQFAAAQQADLVRTRLEKTFGAML